MTKGVYPSCVERTVNLSDRRIWAERPSWRSPASLLLGFFLLFECPVIDGAELSLCYLSVRDEVSEK